MHVAHSMSSVYIVFFIADTFIESRNGRTGDSQKTVSLAQTGGAARRNVVRQNVQKGHPARPQRAKCRGVPLRYVEALSDARTKLGAFFNILFAIAARAERYTSPRQECGIADWEALDAREKYRWRYRRWD